jgi:type I restriction-modification system DNA methylase subunit
MGRPRRPNFTAQEKVAILREVVAFIAEWARRTGLKARTVLAWLGLSASTYHNWRNKKPDAAYEDIAGFCKSASIEEVATHDYVLTPGRYVGAVDVEEDGEPIEEKLARLRTQLLAEFDEAERLENVIRIRLKGLIGG